MKPKLKTAVVRVEYWACDNPNHRHKSASIAAACIEKTQKAKAFKQNARTWDSEQYAAVLKKHREGSRQCDLARELGLSNERVRQILAKAERIERYAKSDDPFAKLSVRTANCLKSEGLNEIEEVRAALNDGRLWDIPNMGRVSVNEVRTWLAGQAPNA